MSPASAGLFLSGNGRLNHETALGPQPVDFPYSDLGKAEEFFVKSMRCTPGAKNA
jgi:hypothetical protein